MRTVRIVVLLLGLCGLLIAMPLLGFAALGWLGVLADVSPAENRGYSVQLITLGIPPLVVGAALCLVALLAFPRARWP